MEAGPPESKLLHRVSLDGEYYASNIVVAGQRVCPVDWELAGAGPGLLDLAALTTGWSYADRAAIAAAYG
jgi:thiamine kinase-like enzyme